MENASGQSVPSHWNHPCSRKPKEDQIHSRPSSWLISLCVLHRSVLVTQMNDDCHTEIALRTDNQARNLRSQFVLPSASHSIRVSQFLVISRPRMSNIAKLKQRCLVYAPVEMTKLKMDKKGNSEKSSIWWTIFSLSFFLSFFLFVLSFMIFSEDKRSSSSSSSSQYSATRVSWIPFFQSNFFCHMRVLLNGLLNFK